MRTESLYAALDKLVRDSRSGIVAMAGDPETPDLWEYVVYFHSLGIVYVVRGDWGSEYFDADEPGLLASVLDGFAARQDRLDPVDLGLDERAFLLENLSSLLLHMVHDEGGVPDGDAEDVFAEPQDPTDSSFTLFGVADLETDIERFHELVLQDGEFEIRGHLFSLGSSEGESGETVYSLGYGYDDVFVDEETGNLVPVIAFRHPLKNRDWRNLYAQSRVFIQQNYQD